MSSSTPKPMLLLILDGWGYSETREYNAISVANTPVWDALWEKYTHTLIDASGEAVGLPGMQMGNSEVGHMNIGAGRVVHQDLARINNAIASGDFDMNPTLVAALDKAAQTGKAVHVLGLLSPGGVHSQESHLHALISLAAKRGGCPLYLHAFLDGRDTPPQSAKASIEAVDKVFEEKGCGRIASLTGRYYAMDRDNRWERVQKAYQLITEGMAEFTAEKAVDALEEAYARGETDEFVQATRIGVPGSEPVKINEGDVVIFMNFRADRARQLSRALVQDDFDNFARGDKIQLGEFVTLTSYADDIPAQVAFRAESLPNVLGEHLAKQGLTQLRIAETEKYAHVTFFLNGGVETPFPGEDRKLIRSPNVATYDLQPEMSAPELTDNLVEAIKSQEYDVIICNYANPDMVGHTGNFDAAVKAIETVDDCLGRIAHALHEAGGEALITADHGNAEIMFDPRTDQPHTAHTTNLVPLLYVGRDAEVTANNGLLSDIAPTLLKLMRVDIPTEMTGRPLFDVK